MSYSKVIIKTLVRAGWLKAAESKGQKNAATQYIAGPTLIEHYKVAQKLIKRGEMDAALRQLEADAEKIELLIELNVETDRSVQFILADYERIKKEI